MSRSIVLSAVAACALATSLLAAPAYAADEFPITVTPDEGKTAASLHVEGDATDPTCADDGVAVSLHYTKPDGTMAATTVNTTADAAGHFEADLTVPDNAYAGEKAFVNAVIADCTPPDGPTSSRSSVAVDFEVLARTGSFKVSALSGKPGDVVDFEGTNCWGGVTAVFFGDDVVTGKPDADKTFEGSYELPDLPGGTYELGAECPGTDYRVYSFTLVNAAPVAPPAAPVPGAPTFTG
ncbi:MAG TPA: hypothetical protein VNQ77_12510 [Frankiaceae bacterium]|nr:hypothetical protein [Frankiaceae bacterium]